MVQRLVDYEKMVNYLVEKPFHTSSRSSWGGKKFIQKGEEYIMEYDYKSNTWRRWISTLGDIQATDWVVLD